MNYFGNGCKPTWAQGSVFALVLQSIATQIKWHAIRFMSAACWHHSKLCIFKGYPWFAITNWELEGHRCHFGLPELTVHGICFTMLRGDISHYSDEDGDGALVYSSRHWFQPFVLLQRHQRDGCLTSQTIHVWLGMPAAKWSIHPISP